MKLFQINEEDLATLERVIPEVCGDLTMHPEATPRQRALFRTIRDIIVNVRWGYGPPTDVEKIPADGE